MSDTGICKHCGKVGTWDSFPLHGRWTTVLKHYCPVKAAKKKQIKQYKDEQAINRILKQPVEELWLGWFIPASGILYTRYPHKEQSVEECFSIEEVSEEVKTARKAHADAMRRYQQAVYDYLKTKKKFPTMKRYQMIAEKV